MSPSDTETSDSTSSSSLDHRPDDHVIPAGAAAASRLSRPRQTRNGSEAQRPTEKVRSLSSPPSYPQDTNDRDHIWQGGPFVPGSRFNNREESWSEDDENMPQTSIKLHVRNRTKDSRSDARNQKDCKRVGGPNSLGFEDNPSRQRPLSAPPKAFPYTRHNEHGQTTKVKAESRGGTGKVEEAGSAGDVRRTSNGDGMLKWDDCHPERGALIHEGRGSTDSGDIRATRKGRSLSSTFGAASEKRGSEDVRPMARTSPYPEGKMKNDRMSGKVGSGLQKSERGGGKLDEAASLSSDEFGLHRWKEYAVLRHGTNRRFVNSQHGREILVETAATIRAEEVEDLNRELKEMRALVEELYSALRAEQAEKSSLQAKVVLLERDVEGMDFARRRWLKEDASNHGRGSNLERRLVGNTGNLRTFLFGASAKSDPPKHLTAPDMSLAAGSSRQGSSRSRSPTITSEEVDGGTAPGKGDAVRRARETAELEKSEIRRRHGVEMAAKQSRIEKLKLEVKKLEAERDGLKQAVESQAGLFKDGYADLKAYLEELKTRDSPSLPFGRTEGSSSEMTPSTEANSSSNQTNNPSQKAHHQLQNHHHRHPSGSSLSDAVFRARVERARVVKEGYPNVAGDNHNGSSMRTSDGLVTSEGENSLLVTGESTISYAARNADNGRRRSSFAGSEGSGTRWSRIMPTDENSSEEDLESPQPTASQNDDNTSTTERWGREENLRRHLRGGRRSSSGNTDWKASKGSQQQPWAAKVGGETTTRHSCGASAKGDYRSPSLDSDGCDAARASFRIEGGNQLHNDLAKKRMPGSKRDTALAKLSGTEIVNAETTVSGGVMIGDESKAADSRPSLLDSA